MMSATPNDFRMRLANASWQRGVICQRIKTYLALYQLNDAVALSGLTLPAIILANRLTMRINHPQTPHP
jgi:hypothetical protein